MVQARFFFFWLDFYNRILLMQHNFLPFDFCSTVIKRVVFFGRAVYGIIVPLEIEPMPPAVKAQSLNHRTAMEGPHHDWFHGNSSVCTCPQVRTEARQVSR